MNNICVMDIETFNDSEKIIPYCICVHYNNEDYVLWYDVNSNIVIKFIEKMSEISNMEYIEIFTHNINFDGLIIIDGIKNANIFFDFFIRDHNIYWIKISYIKITILIRCSYKIIPISVENLGIMININKKIFPYNFVSYNTLDYEGNVPDSVYFNSLNDYMKFSAENDKFNLKKKAIDYCINDIKIVYHVLINLINIIDLYDKNIIKKTYSYSSISYKIFSKKYDKCKITHIKNNTYVHEYIRNSYYGGRCEVFGNPTNNKIIHHFDYTGMYGQCMLEKYPIGTYNFKKNNLNYRNIGFHTVKCMVNTFIPFLPYRHKKLLFPNGTFISTYWYEELINAVDRNKCTILEHYSSLEYNNEDYVFKDYIENFRDLRKNGVYYNIFGKNMINGLYGSFALNEDNFIYNITCSQEEFESYCALMNVKSWTKIGTYYIIKIQQDIKSQKFIDKKKKWDIDYNKRNIAYASITSSKARIKLNNSLEDVVKSGGELYYTDTDSIFAGYDTNMINKTINDITWTDVYEDAVFISSKFYFIKNKKSKIKGVYNTEYDFDDIKNKFYNNDDILTFNNQNIFEKKKFILLQKLISKNLSLIKYDKRIFSKNKLKTLPISIQTM